MNQDKIKKTATALLFFFLFYFNANSQITNGNWLIGGNGAFKSSKSTYEGLESATKSLDIRPRAGYFIVNRLATGLIGSYSWNSAKLRNTKSTASYFGIGPFARYYFLPNENRTNLLIEANGSYNVEGNNIGEQKSSFVAYNLLAGPAIFLNSSVAAELLVGYSGYKISNSTAKSSGVNFNIGLQFHFEKEY